MLLWKKSQYFIYVINIKMNLNGNDHTIQSRLKKYYQSLSGVHFRISLVSPHALCTNKNCFTTLERNGLKPSWVLWNDKIVLKSMCETPYIREHNETESLFDAGNWRWTYLNLLNSIICKTFRTFVETNILKLMLDWCKFALHL